MESRIRRAANKGANLASQFNWKNVIAAIVGIILTVAVIYDYVYSPAGLRKIIALLIMIFGPVVLSIMFAPKEQCKDNSVIAKKSVGDLWRMSQSLKALNDDVDRIIAHFEKTNPTTDVQAAIININSQVNQYLEWTQVQIESWSEVSSNVVEEYMETHTRTIEQLKALEKEIANE
ncbi:hypothetical protein [Corynebacterium sp. HFH0082]|uniref:hypothetical protein n=1 Tax=Corynebacterium sp. HFH0082 TaxID=1078764 RepID=UPI00034E06EA|nr:MULTISPECIES: hypothetical protein [Corynebacterium]EPD47507.1 hypothetical protein HMPREF1206_01683 [Corynebacterium sp. HFH0082]MDK8506052.1 hypothetical protein [Corynebacterium amycolatum]